MATNAKNKVKFAGYATKKYKQRKQPFQLCIDILFSFNFFIMIEMWIHVYEIEI